MNRGRYGSCGLYLQSKLGALSIQKPQRSSASRMPNKADVTLSTGRRASNARRVSLPYPKNKIQKSLNRIWDKMDDQDELWTGFTIADLWQKSSFTVEDEFTSTIDPPSSNNKGRKIRPLKKTRQKKQETQKVNTEQLFKPIQFDDFDKELKTLLEDDFQTEEQIDDLFGLLDISKSQPQHRAYLQLPSDERNEFLDSTLGSTPALSSGDDASIHSTSDDIGKDIWHLAAAEVHQPSKFLTWHAFANKTEEKKRTCYISEASTSAFDTALTNKALLGVDNKDSILVDTNRYAGCLLALGLGRDSTFFGLDLSKKKFAPLAQNLRVSGCSVEMVDSLTHTFLETGNNTRALRSFVESTYKHKSHTQNSPGYIALAEAISTVLKALQEHLNVPPGQIRSLLQLQALFEPVSEILSHFTNLLDFLATGKDGKQKADETMLSYLYTFVQSLEHETTGAYGIFLEVLARVSEPFLDFTRSWIGLTKEAGIPLTTSGPSKSFINCAPRTYIDDHGAEISNPDYNLDESRVPSFVPQEDKEVMFETGRSLRFIREHHPEHPLVSSGTVARANPPNLMWEFGWKDIVGIERKSREYEQTLQALIAEHSGSGTATPAATISERDDAADPFSLPSLEFGIFGKSDSDMEGILTASLFPTSIPAYLSPSSDRLTKLLAEHLSATSATSTTELAFAPPLSLLPSLCLSPIIRAQSRLLNYTTLSLLFTSHDIRTHLRLQRQFQLLGNGIFSSRLSDALFAPDLETAERVKGVARTGGTMGLRLGGGGRERKVWPPASSELRLSLMGVLAESYTPPQSSGFGKSTSSSKSRANAFAPQTDLPGDLSFSIRDLSEEEIEKCLNADGIEALDFLRLSYKAPAQLGGVLGPVALGMYDRMFRLLLRQMRMSYVATALWQSARNDHGRDQVRDRFRIEAHHFVNTVAAYIFDIAIDSPWRIFERKLDEVERLLKRGRYEKFGENDGIEGLRAYHEKVLNRILSGCLLRKRQKPVLGVLEEIWDSVLRFDRLSTTSDKRAVMALYERFKKKVGVFLTVLRGMGEKTASTAKKSSHSEGRRGMFDARALEEGEGGDVRILVERLEMSGYYKST